MAVYSWLIGIGLAFLITIVLTIFVSRLKDGEFHVNGKVFFIFLPIGFGISAYAGLSELWIFILSCLFGLIIIIFELKGSGNE